MEQGKTCTKCTIPKLYSEFTPHKGYADGYNNWCKQCIREYTATDVHRMRNRDRRRLLRQDPEYRKKEALQNKAMLNLNYRTRIVSLLRSRALKRGLDFDLTAEDIPEFPKLCPILKVPMIRFTAYAPSVDRIFSTKGYVKGNIQIISRKANAMKLDATPEELLLFSRYWIKQLKLPIWTK